MTEPLIAIDDPRRDDVRALLEQHLALANQNSPREDVHALDVDGLLNPALTFFSCRTDRSLLGIGALKELDAAHGELKSMHTAAAARGRGIGRAMLTHLVAVARERGYRRLSLETGTMDAFAPARAMYANAGFEPSQPFADYTPSPNSTFFTLPLADLVAGA
ncbi:MAG TPA: GNAT family N-acetyltransferase [Jatrophihabitantaceae bacterium]|nr:GNAT family N-acetyltransferase [Jatrophihabitantaceae bacterium]